MQVTFIKKMDRNQRTLLGGDERCSNLRPWLNVGLSDHKHNKAPLLKDGCDWMGDAGGGDVNDG